MLEVGNLTVEYGKRAVLQDFSLEIAQREVLAIVGESGSGKTTVIRSIMGLLPTEGKIVSGEILFEGENLVNYSEKQWRGIRGTKISKIFQDSGGMMNPIRKIGKQFIEYLQTHSQLSKEESFQKAVELLQATNLKEPEKVMKSYPFELSGGMKQRVGIAMAMSFQPKLLLADEPTSALDVTTQKQIVLQLLELQDKHDTGMILVTHDLGLAAHMAHRIIVMQEGKIVDQGSVDEVIRTPKHQYTQELLAAAPDLEEGDYV